MVLGYPQPHRNPIVELKPEKESSLDDLKREKGVFERLKLNYADTVQVEVRSESDGERKLAAAKLGAANETT